MNVKYFLIFTLVLTLCIPTINASPKVIDELQRKSLINNLSHLIEEHYIKNSSSSEIYRALSELERTEVQLGYGRALAKDLTQKLQKHFGDKHLRVEYGPEYSKSLLNKKNESDFSSESERQMWRSQNMGFKKVERLPFNMGLIQLEAFAPFQYASKLIASSFNFVNNSDALIIDLRGNFGGYEYTAPLFASYVLKNKTHLYTVYDKNDTVIEKRWSQSNLDGLHYSQEKPVYILIDKNTFSAGESLAYTLKHLKRAILVGETTAGAGNAGDEFSLTEGFYVFIPTRKMINPVTQSSFEGKGVAPDIFAKSSNALLAAQEHYLGNLLSQEKDEGRKQRISNRLSELKTKSK